MRKHIQRSLIFIILPLATFTTIAPVGRVTAQITPDGSLGAESSIVNPDVINGIPSDRISGGATRGSNLFHSFQEFNVDAGRGAFFENPASITNILTRVTGGNPSNILGILGVLGNANLFLINPKGIFFGPQAQLAVNGSFFASTADSILFDNNLEFSASNPQAIPQLTINIPIGLRFRGNPGSITNNGSLSVQPGNSLALVGGDVNLDGGILTAAGGRVELGGLTEAGTIDLNPNFSLRFSEAVTKGNLLLTNAAKIDVADTGSGSVTINARNLNINGGSRITGGIKSGLTSNGSVPGDINLNVTELMAINQDSIVENIADVDAIGNTGNININANKVEITGAGRIRTRTLGNNSDAGDINIKATDIYINNPAYKLRDANNQPLEDKPALDASNYLKDKTNPGRGRSGNISLIADGSITIIGQPDKVISTYNALGGTGGGDISLIAKGSIYLDNAFFVTTVINNNADASAGKILLQGDESVSLINNSILAATTYGRGNPGNITLQSNGPVTVRASLITTDIRNLATKPENAGKIFISGQSVLITDGSEVTAKTSSRGNTGGSFGGSIQINARDTVEISGIYPLFANPELLKQSRLKLVYSTLATTTESGANGPAGDIFINADTLRVTDGGSIKASSEGAFSGGNIIVNTRVVKLTDGGKILATASKTGNAGNIKLNASDRITISGSNPTFEQVVTREIENGKGKVSREEAIQKVETRYGPAASGIYANTSGGQGNITINSGDLILRRNGTITTNATGKATGGNITINTENLVALENSDITANSQESSGGNIFIRADNIFRSSDSDITATGASPELSGTVQIETAEVDPSQGLLELPENLADPSSKIADNPCQKGTGSEFIITGRGGLPSNPNDFFESDDVRIDLMEIVTNGNNPQKVSINQPQINQNTNNTQKVTPAQGWVLNNKGEVVLTAYDPTTTSTQRASNQTVGCPVF